MRNLMKWISGCSAAMVLAGCAGGPPRLEPTDRVMQYATHAGEPIPSFNALRFDGWTPLTRDKLVIWTGMNEAYLITVRPSCPDLLFASGIRVSSPGGVVSRLDTVRVGRDRCPISEIRPVNVREMKAERKAQAGQ